VRTTPLCVIVALTSSACYQYLPVNDSAPLPDAGAEVRVQLQSPQSLDLGTMTLNDVSTVEGHVHQSSADTLSLFSNKLRTSYGFRQRTNGAVFYFDRSLFRSLEQRKLVPWKTGVAVGTTVAGIAALMYFAADLGGGSQSGSTPPPPPGASRTAFFPISLLFPSLVPR
jgi:hypothetical protein